MEFHFVPSQLEHMNHLSKGTIAQARNMADLWWQSWRMITEPPTSADFHLNCGCLSGGVLQTTLPRQTMTGIQLDVNKHCEFQFGEPIVSHAETDSTMQPRGSRIILATNQNARWGILDSRPEEDRGESSKTVREVTAHDRQHDLSCRGIGSK